MNYSFFLFTQLYNACIGVQYEYDLMYEDLVDVYGVYRDSRFDTYHKSEYDCMVDFLNDHKTDIIDSLKERGIKN